MVKKSFSLVDNKEENWFSKVDKKKDPSNLVKSKEKN